MVRRGADEGQAERRIDPLVEGERLGRDQRLVVIHAQRDVIAGAGTRMKHGIGRQRPEGVDAFRAQRLDRRAHHGLVLLAHGTAFAGMRVEAGDGQPRLLQPETVLQVPGGDAARGDDQLAGQRRRHFGERNMDGDRHGAQVRSRQKHHRYRLDPGVTKGQMRQILGMAGKAEAGVIKRLLGDGAGDDGGGLAGKAVLDGAVDGLDDAGRVGLVRFAGHVCEASGERYDRQRPLEDDGRIGRRRLFDFDLGADHARTRGDHGRVGQQVEGRNAVTFSVLPCGDRRLGTDAGRVADAQRQRNRSRGSGHDACFSA